MQLPAPNYDESLVPAYVLPELLRAEDGELIDTPALWEAKRRPELLALFRRYVYGDFSATVSVEKRVVVDGLLTCGGLVRQSELDVCLRNEKGACTVRVLVFEPSQGDAPFPAFLGLNLFGNQTVQPDSRIRLAQGWAAENPDLGLIGNRATEASRGMHAARFPVEMLAARGYALVTAYVGDLDPDFHDGFQNGVHALLPVELRERPDAPGSIAAWAFGLSRILDVLETWPTVDSARVAVFGHSRLGKAALWAGAQDTRFALCISNQSGCGGAALSRRCFGERLLHINERFPHWFCPAFRNFNEREQQLPLDQHQLLALLAPRPLYVASAAADLWADPQGELLACREAGPAYELYGLSGLTPPPHIGHHVRPGRHDITPRDFHHYLEFADSHLARSARPSLA